MPDLFLLTSVSLLATVLLTPLTRLLALRFGLVDRPDPERKLYRGVIPLAGGLSVLAATCLAPLVVGLFSESQSHLLTEHRGQLQPLLAAAFILAAVGVLDDRVRLRGRQKLAGQVLAVTVLITNGVLIRTIAIFGIELDLGLLSVPFTVLWLLGAINALNLIDGADGLATTVGVICAISIAIMASLGGQASEAMVAASLAGALLGFLFYNFPPARVFLGDAGSMLIGLIVGALAIRSSLKGPATVVLAGPVAMLTIPIFDSAMAILRRKLTGHSIYIGDRGHLHHRLLHHGWSDRGMLLVVSLLSAATALGALFSVYLKNELFALMSGAIVVAILVTSRVFGFSELVLLVHRLASFSESLIVSGEGQGKIRQNTVRLQGSYNWDEMWHEVTEFAQQHRLARVELDMHLPWLHEGYNASWDCGPLPESIHRWTTVVPLSVEGHLLGRLEFVGRDGVAATHAVFASLAELLESIDHYAVELVSSPIGPNRASVTHPIATSSDRELIPTRSSDSDPSVIAKLT